VGVQEVIATKLMALIFIFCPEHSEERFQFLNHHLAVHLIWTKILSYIYFIVLKYLNKNISYLLLSLCRSLKSKIIFNILNIYS